MWQALKGHLSVVSVLAEGSERLLGYVLLRKGQECNPIAVKDLFQSSEFTIRPMTELPATPLASPAKGTRVMLDESA